MRRGLTALLTSSVAVALMSCGSASPVTGSSASPTVASASPTVAPELSQSSLHTLLVTGTGMVSAPPNQVVICLGANAEAASAPLAMTQANADMARLLASLRRQGVQPADISTTELSLYRGYNEPYQASQSVDVTVRHIANAGTVIAAAMNADGNDATVSGVTYSIHDPSWKSLQLARLRWRTRAWRHSSWRNSLGIRSEQCYLFPMSSSLRDRRAAAAKDAAALEARCHSPQAWIRSRSLST